MLFCTRGRKVERSRNMHKPNEDHTNDVCVGMDSSHGQQFNQVSPLPATEPRTASDVFRQEWEQAAGRAGLPDSGGRAVSCCGCLEE